MSHMPEHKCADHLVDRPDLKESEGSIKYSCKVCGWVYYATRNQWGNLNKVRKPYHCMYVKYMDFKDQNGNLLSRRRQTCCKKPPTEMYRSAAYCAQHKPNPRRVYVAPEPSLAQSKKAVNVNKEIEKQLSKNRFDAQIVALGVRDDAEHKLGGYMEL